ncbi:MAG: hypothetical protein JWP10_1358 [Nocardioidaceae bacterium]|nr:hypothetical protein [Nocardioidaceae bacterium]
MSRRLRLLVLTVVATALVIPAAQLPAQAASSVTVSGVVAGFGPRPANLQVYIWEPKKGFILNRGKRVAVAADGSYRLTGIKLAKGNKARKYYFSVRGEVNGVSHEWFYARGKSGEFIGSKYINGATSISVKKGGVGGVNFRYSAIRGHVNSDRSSKVAGVEVRVVSVPRNFKKLSKFDRRELDIANCANDFGTTVTDSAGNYVVGFLPAGVYRTKFSLFGSGYLRQWRGTTATNRGYQTCTQAGPAEFAVSAAGEKKSVNYTLRVTTASISGKVKFTYAQTRHDQFITVRDYNAERKVVTTGTTDAKGNYRVANVPPGLYVVEYGRHTSCATWLPTVNKNNNSYLEKGVSRWKAYTWPYHYSSKRYLGQPARVNIPKPYTRVVGGVKVDGYGNPAPGSGKRGWMWRDHCRADGVSTSTLVNVGSETAQVRVKNITKVKGGQISGRILRVQTRKPKSEILVTVYDQGGTTGKKVTRTAITDRRGGFVVRGLAPGTYQLSVNADSWRGIGRGFGTGYTPGTTRILKPGETNLLWKLKTYYKQSMTVKVGKAGKRYSVGTLYTKNY